MRLHWVQPHITATQKTHATYDFCLIKWNIVSNLISNRHWALDSFTFYRNNQAMSRVYFILGCTGCGKGAVGRTIAKRVVGQVISADSMKVYRRMDIGTAKPSAEVRSEVPHWCVDIVEPSEAFSVQRFVEFADDAIAQIASAGQVALAVGGTSLYIQALSKGLFAGPAADEGVRSELRSRAEREGLGKLHDELRAVDPEAAGRIHPNDAMRIFRALEVYQLTGKGISQLQQQWDSSAMRHDCTFIGLRREKAIQSMRINARVKKMIDAGLADEVKSLIADHPGLSRPAAQAVGYAEFIDHFAGKLTFDQTVERIKINTRQLAKKQRTWHRRFPDVHWFDIEEDEPADVTASKIINTIDIHQNVI